MTIAHIKGDDHKTKGRIGHNLTLEISIWGGDSGCNHYSDGIKQLISGGR